MNAISLVGRLVKEAVVTAGEKEGAVFTLAVQGYGEKVDFIPCSAWGSSATYIERNGKKGDLLSLQGRLTTYKDKDGNLKTGVVANSLQILAHAKVDKKE